MFNLTSILSASLVCDQYQQAEATCMFRSGPSTKKFWSDIFLKMSKITGDNVAPNAVTAMFEVWSTTLKVFSQHDSPYTLPQ